MNTNKCKGKPNVGVVTKNLIFNTSERKNSSSAVCFTAKCLLLLLSLLYRAPSSSPLSRISIIERPSCIASAHRDAMREGGSLSGVEVLLPQQEHQEEHEELALAVQPQPTPGAMSGEEEEMARSKRHNNVFPRW